MEEVIQYLKELGSIPLITIPSGAIVGAFITYLLSINLRKRQSVELTKQLLLFIHKEIDINKHRLKNRAPFNVLSLMGYEKLISNAGNLFIDHDRLSSLIKIYSFFSILNKFTRHTANDSIREEAKKQEEMLNKEIKEYEEKYLAK
jgi:hypothetical protein